MNRVGLLGGKVVVFNGPPSSGKDTFTHYLMAHTGVIHAAFKNRLIEIALAISGVDSLTWERWYSADKEKGRDELWGLSCRAFLIKVSERMIKPHFGQSYFGECEAKNIRRYPNEFKECGFCFSDSGFNAELAEVVKEAGPENVIVVQLHRSGTSFKGDSRAYLNRQDFPGVMFIQQQNDRPIKDVAADLLETLECVIADNRKSVNT